MTCNPFGPSEEEIDAVSKATRSLRNPMFVGESDVLAKRSDKKFHIGQSVIEKAGQERVGTVVDITSGSLLEVRFGSGVSGLCVFGSVEPA